MSQARAASEPLLWLQLLGLSLLPLEALLLLLLLAGSDPGRLPALERLLCWAIGGLAPAVLLWRRPADVWSLLLVKTPARGRRELQRRLSVLQEGLGLQLTLVLGGGLLLALLWRLDAAAALAASFAPLPNAPRLVDLLLCSPVLALMLWQWQQAAQAVWLLSRPADTIAAAAPLSATELLQRRLSLGLPLLLPAPLQFHAPSGSTTPARVSAEPAAAEPSTAAAPSPAPEVVLEEASQITPEAEDLPRQATADSAATGATTDSAALIEQPAELAQGSGQPDPGVGDPSGGSGVAAVAAAVDPEQAAEYDQGPDLDQPVG